ncbi:metalloregulator ArsR/SmtB family transcription factor [Isoptericola sp. NEAU-Y5]|uniref:Metalloregulator ArsR/SmtB family transcription factor n=1 Tax=Isoptericola luteus TaxID=2879484 RepID=A0ABS7ZL30_9MICO|nr:metalloregulator ArsR/SmtB family transcription factor [Isoptericola sp. NEAU-Y5]MCA5894354.1 metalloregulator ArsR/SmtB family transcription factor [Isoptericola sp. NEAU-Y5]
MDVFEALADPVRRELLLALRGADLSASELGDPQPGSQPGVSRHLRRLREAGLVDVEARGRHRVYSLRPDALAPVEHLVATLRAEPATGTTTEADVRPPLPAGALAGLDLEVRRTTRERRAARTAAREEETA